jgi:recombination protein RecT
MVRPHLHLHPPRTPAPLLKAATVLLLRDSPQGVQVLMTRRSLKASFAPGAYVFPGGGIEATDGDPATWAVSQRRATQTDEGLTQALAAIRESLEELGVLLAQHPDGRWATDTDVALFDRHAPLAAQCQRLGLTLAAHEVWQLAHWQTDRDLPKRFDVPFLVAPMPPQQTPVADESEQFEPQWVVPAEALARHAAGEFFIIFPTIRTLQRLQAYASVADVLAAVAPNAQGQEQPLWTSCPRAGLLQGQDARYMEHESPYGELAMVCPDGHIAHHLDWQHQHPVPLLQHLQRLTAPNASVMTGPGTNSYIVGTADTGFGVIDPGPNDTHHVQRLLQATGGDIRWIVCTHSHADHAPAARPLAAAVAAHGRPLPPVLGLASGPGARPGSTFAPDQLLQNNEHLTLKNSALQPDLACNITLQAVHTPGHAANHLCLLLLEDGLLFTGDHILNGSTTVVDPPDGHMGHYLQSLDVLDALCAQHQVGFLLPAHGYVLGEPRRVIAGLKAHRRSREAKVARAMAAQPTGGLDDWLPLAYDDVDARLWPVARRSLLAHVQLLQPDFVD